MILRPRRPLRLGIAGLGGFAANHHSTILALEAAGHCRLVCTCDPRAADFAEARTAWRFSERGVRVFIDYADMLDACRGDLDYVVISTPIPLHAPMHAQAVAAGVPVYLEKPPTLDPAELDAMIATEADAPAATLVAFNYIVEAPRLALKRRLLDGEFGAIRRTSLLAFSPRPTTYFTRAPWTGRVYLDGRLVLDSCLGNALAHSAHNMLFWSGAGGEFTWDEPDQVRATLHRAHAIEGADTFFVEARLRSGVMFRLALTHAGAGPALQEELVECEHARLRCVPGRTLEVLWHDGREERYDCTGFEGVAENHLAYQRYLLGDLPRPATTLADSRPFVTLHALAWIAAGGISTIPSSRISVRYPGNEYDAFLDVGGLAGAQRAFIGQGVWSFSKSTDARVGMTATPADLGSLGSALLAIDRFAPPPGINGPSANKPGGPSLVQT